MSESSASKGKFPTEIIVAVLGVIGVGLTAYFGYLQIVTPTRLSLQATQTAEARATDRALTQTAGAEQATPTSTQTPSPSPTDTPTLKPSVTPTATRSGQPTGLRYCINAFRVNVRQGPGTFYAVIGYLTSEDCLHFDARSEDGAWLRISPGQPEQYSPLEGGWIYSELLGLPENVGLPIITLTPSPTPTEEPTPTPTPLG